MPVLPLVLVLLFAFLLSLVLPLGPWFPEGRGLFLACVAGLCEGAYFIALARALALASDTASARA
jgi:hypothetical protein